MSFSLDFSLGADLILDGGLEIVGSYKARDPPVITSQDGFLSTERYPCRE